MLSYERERSTQVDVREFLAACKAKKVMPLTTKSGFLARLTDNKNRLLGYLQAIWYGGTTVRVSSILFDNPVEL